MRFVRKILPAAISLALILWLLWHVAPREAKSAARALQAQRFFQEVQHMMERVAGEVDLRQLLPATAVLVVVLYLWESFCFRAVFSLAGRPLSYRQMLRVRGISYLAGVVNYEAGQAMAAWRVAELQQTSLMSALSRTVLLAYHDLLVLFGLATLGALLATDPRVVSLRWFPLSGVLLLAALGLVPLVLRREWVERWKQTRWGAWLDSWSWRRSAQLVLLRVVYFAIFVAYAAVALHICRLPLEHAAALGTIPLVLLADALPSASGLGTRDTALQLLLKPQRPEMLLAMSLTWSMGLLLGRLSIGLFHLWSDEGFSPLRRKGSGFRKELRGAGSLDAGDNNHETQVASRCSSSLNPEP